MTAIPGSVLSNGLLNMVLGSAAFTIPGTTYWAAYTTNPAGTGVTGGGVEPSTGSYARVAVVNNTANYPASTAAAKTNGSAITWPTATANWGTITAVAFHNASSGGTYYCGWTLPTPVIVNNGDTFQVAANSLNWTITGS